MIRQIGDLGRPDSFVRSLSHKDGWRAGLGASVLRAVLLNGLLTWSFDHMKTRIRVAFGETMVDKPLAMMCTALLATVVVLPVDNIKTRLQYAYVDPKLNRLNYGGSISNVIGKTLNHEGLSSFYAGAFPYYLKMFVYAMSVG